MNRRSPSAVLLPALALLAACQPGERNRPESGAEPAEDPWFVEVAAETGLEFTYDNGWTGDYHLPEIMGGGAAWLDYDGDGDLDAFLPSGGGFDEERRSERPLGVLFRNDPVEAPPGRRFVAVEGAVPRAAGTFGMGVAAADYDGDGEVDLYLTAFGANRLLRNRGDGTFADVTAAAGVGEERWSVAATFFDADADGRPDLYVGNYLDYRLKSARTCRDLAGRVDFCGPDAYRGVTDRLFRNRGDGTFEDVSGKSGIGGPAGKGLGAVAADLDGDRALDLYVANDGMVNYLWREAGGGRFEEVALAAGCAVDAAGRPQASMGVDAADPDDDGDLDLFLTHLTGEPNTLYRNEGRGVFVDVSAVTGSGPPSWPLTGFGARWADFDGDGRLDLLAVNGAVRVIQAAADRGDPLPFAQPKLLLRGTGDGYRPIASRRAGLSGETVGRGAAFGDADNDGDLDVLVVNSGSAAELLLAGASPHGWVGVAGPEGGRAELAAPGGARTRRLARDGSYASAHDPRALLPAAAAGGAILTIDRGGGGRRLRFAGPVPGRYYRFPAGGES